MHSSFHKSVKCVSSTNNQSEPFRTDNFVFACSWDSVGQAALNGVVSALPSILIGALGLFGKRSLDVNIQQLLAQLPVNQLAQLVQVVLNSDKTQALSKLKQLLQQFFPNLKGMLNFDDLAAALLNQLNSFLPNISQTIFGNIFG